MTITILLLMLLYLCLRMLPSIATPILIHFGLTLRLHHHHLLLLLLGVRRTALREQGVQLWLQDFGASWIYLYGSSHR